jgi:hypothetical protein
MKVLAVSYQSFTGCGARKVGLMLFITAVPNIKLFAWGKRDSGLLRGRVCVCVYISLQYLFQCCSRAGRGIVKDMCYENYERQPRQARACTVTVTVQL